MPNHSKGENDFSKYMDKKLCFQVYGYNKVIIKVLKNHNNTYLINLRL
jgi:hypothetical protein